MSVQESVPIIEAAFETVQPLSSVQEQPAVLTDRFCLLSGRFPRASTAGDVPSGTAMDAGVPEGGSGATGGAEGTGGPGEAPADVREDVST